MTDPHALLAYRLDTKNRALITFSGEIDLQSAPLVRQSLSECLRDGFRTIDVDLAAVTFCDCSGLNAFLTASQRTITAGGSLRLRHPSPAVTRLFTLTGSDFLLRPHPGAPTGLLDLLPTAV
jgi:anti-sigma B factor antagonist